LLSIATAQWQKKDARAEITKFVEEINRIGDGFDFDKDFILKTCLVLCEFGNITFNVDNFNKKNMLVIEREWNNITQAIRLAVTTVSGFGYSRETLTSNYAIIPIAHYILKNNLPENFPDSNKYSHDRDHMHRWVIMSLLKRLFGTQPDGVLRLIRDIIKNHYTSFPLDNIIDKFRAGARTLIFNEDEIENLFGCHYGQSYTFSTLALLYPSFDFRNRFDVDHIFPKSRFTKSNLLRHGIPKDKIDFYLNNYDCLANLQLLDGTKNKEKSNTDFKEWFGKMTNREKNDYMTKHFIPDVNCLSLDKFEEFYNKRKKLMTKKFKALLKA
jgi:hypothetical protein